MDFPYLYMNFLKIFFPLYQNLIRPFGPFWPFWPFRPFLTFEAVFTCQTFTRREKLPLKWKKVPSYMAKRSHLGYFFLLRQKLSLGGTSLPPLDLNYTPRFARDVKPILGGKDRPREHFYLRRKKYPRWDPFPM